MMADYIRREDAIKYAEHAYHEWNLAMAAADGKREINLVYKRQELCKAVESVFRDMPAADVAPVVRGKPITKIREVTITEYHEARGVFASDGSNVYIKNMVHAKVPYDHCPVCGAVLCSRWHNYCGKCGARMDGGNEGE